MKLIQSIFAAAILAFTAITAQAAPLMRTTDIAPAAGLVETVQAPAKKAAKKKVAKKATKKKAVKKTAKKGKKGKKATKKRTKKPAAKKS